MLTWTRSPTASPRARTAGPADLGRDRPGQRQVGGRRARGCRPPARPGRRHRSARRRVGLRVAVGRRRRVRGHATPGAAPRAASARARTGSRAPRARPRPSPRRRRARRAPRPSATPARGTNGTTSTTPRRGCTPSCVERSRRATAAAANRRGASSPTRVNTDRWWCGSVWRRAGRPPQAASSSASSAVSRPSLMFTTQVSTAPSSPVAPCRSQEHRVTVLGMGPEWWIVLVVVVLIFGGIAAAQARPVAGPGAEGVQEGPDRQRQRRGRQGRREARLLVTWACREPGGTRWR